ncbi:MAG: V-type ATP synthase subunit I [Oscillospiraceae bacterium]|nr:V-type ATP synthase subunit I [Oscillospiraceae bacterium]
MSIVKMKRLRLVGYAADRDALLRGLMDLGCVELDTLPQDNPELALLQRQESHLLLQRERLGRLNQAMEILRKQAPEKGGLFAGRGLISTEELFGDAVIAPAMEIADALIEKAARITHLHTEIGVWEESTRALLPWQDLDLPLDVRGTAHTSILFGTTPLGTDLGQMEQVLYQAAPESQLYQVGQSRDSYCLMVVCHKEVVMQVVSTLRRLGMASVNFSEEGGTAGEIIAAREREIEAAKAEIAEAKTVISDLASRRGELKLCIDRVAQEVALEEAKEKLSGTESTFTLEGWFSVPEEAQLTALLEGFSCKWEYLDPLPIEYPQVPIKLKGNKITEPLNMVTEMYGLPAYDGIDPNGLIMPFFAIFFGLMYADLGYGLILLTLSLFLRRKRLSRGMKNAAGLLFQVGITTAILGGLFGIFFGDALPMFSETFLGGRIDLWALFDPMQNPIVLMIGAIILGAFQLLVGMCVKAYLCIRDGRPLDALFDVGTWWLVFGGIALLALGHGPWLVIVGVLSVIVAQGRGAPTIPGKILRGLGKLYDLTTFLSNLLSYLRLMALFLATGVIASVFNILASMLGGAMGSVIGIFGFLLVFLVGHVFNMGINIIGTYVHTIRLQYLEFFGQFYKEGGRPFKPLAIHTKYYDIKE